jgi:HisA/HisF family protein
MEIIPVLDLRHGAAVHARRGQRGAYRPVDSVLLGESSGDALALARAYRGLAGVRYSYVADLDAIEGRGRQEAMLRALASEEGFGAGVWVDAAVGRVRDLHAVLALGVSGVVVGLETLDDLRVLPSLVEAAAGARVLFSLDLRGGRPIRLPGGAPGDTPEVLAAMAADAGVHGVLVLDLDLVGSDEGPSHLGLLAALKRRLGCPVYTGGGIRGVADLAAIEATGCEGVLVGTALHSGRVTLPYGVTGSR